MFLSTSTRVAERPNNSIVMKIFEEFFLGGMIFWVDEVAGLTEFLDLVEFYD
jgi:hypothetical protein